MNTKPLALAAALIAGTALTACQDDSNDNQATNAAQPPVTETVTESQAAPNTSEQPSGSQDPNAEVTLDGREVSLNQATARCSWGEDDGQPQLDFDIDANSNDDGLDVEIVLTDPLRLDDLNLDEGPDEWEAEDHHRRDATVEVEGDRYTVTSQVEHDDNHRTAELVASFTCTR